MTLDKSFDPRKIEERWYTTWEQNGYFQASPDTSLDAYCIQLPPPNVTGTLHMGHAFQQTLMDSLIRYHRMRGLRTNWVIGTDHAGIATQIVVERQLEAQGSSRVAIGREEFVKRVWSWKQESGSTILRQMRRLGASGNWTYSDTTGECAGYFTMDQRMSRAVVEVFVRLFEDGLIYRGKRLVNWDPQLGTAVSDLEVDTEEEEGSLWYIRYRNADGPDSLVVATTRPETMFGDVAIAVHPEDARYKSLIGARFFVPITSRTIPVIADEHVDPAFGTGCVKVTPAHDFNDLKIGQRHGLDRIEIFTLEAKLNQNVPEEYRGMDRFDARRKLVQELDEQGYLEQTKPHLLRVPRSGRTGAIVEPMLTDQWFLDLTRDKQPDGRPGGLSAITQPALSAVASGEIRFVPEHWSSTYNHWLNDIQDWCVSRQLWWGHQIPAWYDEEGNVYVARSEQDAIRQAGGKRLRRDPDVLDTWFSSALVPFSSLGWPEHSNDLDAFLPSSTLVTGFDIIFFWVARMIMMTKYFTGKVPFRDVYINAIVRDADGQKMSKSKGNTIDPIDLIDGVSLSTLIEKSTVGLMRADHAQKIERRLTRTYPNGIPAFGADALRFTFASLATFSRTLNFDLNRCEGYKNFCNKLWNATRFVLFQANSIADRDVRPVGAANYSNPDRWIKSRMQHILSEVHAGFAEFRFDNVASAIYHFVWDEFCDWYLELAKVQMQSDSLDVRLATRETLLRVLESVLRLAHPIIPFITEELWQRVSPLASAGQGSLQPSVMLCPYPETDPALIDHGAEAWMARLRAVVDAIRNLRGEMGLSPSHAIPLSAAGDLEFLSSATPYLSALARISRVTLVESLPETANAPVAVVGNTKLVLEVTVDPAVERVRLEKEMARLKNEITKSTSKLDNSNFLARAPSEVVQQERQRLAQFEGLLAKISEQIRALGT